MPRHALNDGENRGGSAAHVCAFIENAEHQYVFPLFIFRRTAGARRESSEACQRGYHHATRDLPLRLWQGNQQLKKPFFTLNHTT